VSEKTQNTMIDPICGMHLDLQQVVATYTYLGQEYGFCSHECHDMFSLIPERYIIYLAHEPEGHWGHRCPRQRES
jgi:YHS domain-containing protein